METIKDVYNNIRGEIQFEWKIKDFLQSSGDIREMYFLSPEVSFCSITCAVMLYTNPYKDDETIRWIELCIEPRSVLGPTTVDFSFYLKKVDGKTDAHIEFKHFFEDLTSESKYYKFIKRSKLIEKEYELLPSDTLTVVCILKKSGAGISQLEQGTSQLQLGFQQFLQNRNLSDVVLKVGNKKLKSHRCVLAACSPVFLAMLTQDTKEKKIGVVNIPDSDPDTFAEFLNYVYTGNKEIITEKNAAELYTVADRYQVIELKERCLDCMINNISVEDFCNILSFSLTRAEKELTDACSQFFIQNASLIVETSKWQAFFLENPSKCDELYKEYIKKWGKK